MIFTKKINIKLAIIGITFMGLLLLTNSVLMEYGLERSIYFTYQAHHKESEKRLSYDIELLFGRGYVSSFECFGYGSWY